VPHPQTTVSLTPTSRYVAIVSFESFVTVCLPFFFFFKHPATTEIYTLSLHDALPIWQAAPAQVNVRRWLVDRDPAGEEAQIVSRSEEHTSELQSQSNLVCRLLLEKKKKKRQTNLTRAKHVCRCDGCHVSTRLTSGASA